MAVGWIIISFFTLLIGMSMAEILSSIPASGGPYFWAYMLAPQTHAPFFAWITGWQVGHLCLSLDFLLTTYNQVQFTWSSCCYHGHRLLLSKPHLDNSTSKP